MLESRPTRGSWLPNKRHPNQDVDSFQSTLDSLRGLWVEMHDVLQEAVIPPDDRERLHKESCVDAFLRAAIAFEGFRSDWHITAIHRDSKTFRKRLESRIWSKIRGDEALKGASSHIAVKLPAHLTLERTRTLVDPLGRNVSLKSSGKRTWATRADQELGQPYRSAVRGLPPADWKLMAAVDALRNHLAHRSRDSVEQMNSDLAALDSTDSALRRGPSKVRASGVPRYLWAYAEGHNGLCRLVVYYDRLGEVAERLRVD